MPGVVPALGASSVTMVGSPALAETPLSANAQRTNPRASTPPRRVVLPELSGSFSPTLPNYRFRDVADRTVATVLAQIGLTDQQRTTHRKSQITQEFTRSGHFSRDVDFRLIYSDGERRNYFLGVV